MGIVHRGVPQRLALWLRDEAAAKEFIETGTYLADTALWAARHFERVISIEADRKLYDAAQRRATSNAIAPLQLPNYIGGRREPEYLRYAIGQRSRIAE
jgi:hypothetical protein